MENKIKIATDNYAKGYNCAQAVISAYAKELGITEKTLYKLMEGFGGGFGGKQEVCGAFSAACAVISYYSSDGNIDNNKSRAATYKIIRKAAEDFSEEYDSIICKEILHGNSPKAFQCSMKVADAVKIVEKIKSELLKEALV